MADNSKEFEYHALIDQDTKRKGWTKQDYILILMGSLISFGDGIELYLPGYSCNLNSV